MITCSDYFPLLNYNIKDKANKIRNLNQKFEVLHLNSQQLNVMMIINVRCQEMIFITVDFSLLFGTRLDVGKMEQPNKQKETSYVF